VVVHLAAVRGADVACGRGEHEEPLLQLFCGCCQGRFFACESCYRGQGYCSPRCRRASRAALGRSKQRRYRRTAAGL